MPDALPPLQGGCLCGAVRYEAIPDHRDGYYCHCRMCQLAFGNTRAAFFNLRKSEVRWLTPPPAYYGSSKIARRGFCSRCGTPMSFEFLDSERMDLSAGSLDEPGAAQAHRALRGGIAHRQLVPRRRPAAVAPGRQRAHPAALARGLWR